MKKFNYKGIDNRGKPVSGSTTASSEEEVLPVQEPVQSAQAEEPPPEDFVQKLLSVFAGTGARKTLLWRLR
jgi:hypothetical protein